MYRDEIAALREKVIADNAQHAKAKMAGRGIMSASLFNLLPGIPVAQHEDVIDQITFFQRWAIKDQNHLELIDDFVVEGTPPDVDALRAAPTIFCSYHIGSYRLLVPYLVRMKLGITLLIDSAVAEMQSDDFMAVVRSADPRAVDEGRFEIIDTAHSNLMIRMMRALRRGHSLVVFIDGNASVNGNKADPASMEALQFLGQTLYARRGVAFLSHLTGASVTPVLTKRTGAGHWENRVCWYSRITPGGDRETYVRTTIARLYQILEEALPDIVPQWESWRYIDKSLAVRNIEIPVRSVDVSAVARDTALQLNLTRYAKYQLEENQYLLFDRCSYRSLLISPAFSLFLDGFKAAQSVEAALRHPNMSPAALQGLLGKGILVKTDIEVME